MIKVVQVKADDWKNMSENAHLVCFGKMKPAYWDRIDYALLMEREKQLLAYVTCRELDVHSVYWQFGGAFPGAVKTSLSYQAYQAALDWTKKKYKRVSFLVENDNFPMLKMAIAGGFKIVGVKNFKGNILVEHLLEFEDEA